MYEPMKYSQFCDWFIEVIMETPISLNEFLKKMGLDTDDACNKNDDFHKFRVLLLEKDRLEKELKDDDGTHSDGWILKNKKNNIFIEEINIDHKKEYSKQLEVILVIKNVMDFLGDNHLGYIYREGPSLAWDKTPDWSAWVEITTEELYFKHFDGYVGNLWKESEYFRSTILMCQRDFGY